MTLALRLIVAHGGTSFPAATFPTNWNPVRDAGNPLITIPAAETTEQYVPAPVRCPNGDIWVYCKGASRIYAWKSTDGGATFSIQNAGVAVLTPGGVGTWDHNFTLEPTAVYDDSTDLIHLYYKGRDADTSKWQWGHATAPGATPTVFTKDPANPIFTKAQALADLGKSTQQDFAISSVHVSGSTFYFYGYGGWNSRTQLVMATGTTWNNPSGLTSLLLAENDNRVVETPSVVRIPGAGPLWAMMYSRGDPQPGTRDIEVASSSNLTTWDFSNVTPILSPTGTGWEQNEAYSGQFLKDSHGAPIIVGGYWMFYYSGLSAAPIAQSGLVRMTPT